MKWAPVSGQYLAKAEAEADEPRQDLGYETKQS